MERMKEETEERRKKNDSSSFSDSVKQVGRYCFMESDPLNICYR